MEPYFERRVRSKVVEAQLQVPEAEQQEAGRGEFHEELRDGRPFARSVKWMGNSPPVVCIVSRERDHAVLANALRTLQKGTTNLEQLGCNQVLANWRGLQAGPARIQLEQLEISATKETKPRRRNQYRPSPAVIIKSIAKQSRAVQLGQHRKRTAEYQHSGAPFIKWMHWQRRLLHPSKMQAAEYDEFRRAQHDRHNL